MHVGLIKTYKFLKSGFTAYQPMLFVCLLLATLLSAGCTGGTNSATIDSLFGAISDTPILSAVPTQMLQQTKELSVDINNVKESQAGSDKDMSYTCKWSRLTGGAVTAAADCLTLPNGSATFAAASGLLKWTPSAGELGQYKIEVVGTNKAGSDTREFIVDVRLQFGGIESLTGVQGDRITLNWTANPNATGYQILRKSTDGTYSVFHTVTDPNLSTLTLTNLVPLTNYTFRIVAIDSLGAQDGNTVSLSAVTADLVRLEVTSAASQLSPGQSTTVTVKLKDNAGNYLSTSGLSVGFALSGTGTSSGTFSATTDLGNGIYTAVFTATSPGTLNPITASLTQYYYVELTAPMTVRPLQVEITTSAAKVNPNKTITLTARIRDFTGALVSSGGHALAFTYSGGTSTATISTATDLGSGTYTATLTGGTAGTAVTIGATLSTASTIYSTVTVQTVPYTIEITSALSNLSVTRSTTVSAKVKDWLGNYVTVGGQGLTFQVLGSAGIVTLSSTTDNNNGTYSATVSGLSLGTIVVSASMTPSHSVSQTASITVRKLRLEITSSAAHLMPTQTATLTGRVKDWQGNLVGVGSQSFDFAASGGTSSGSIGTVTDLGTGVYTATFTAGGAGTALTVSGSISETYQVDITAPITVEKWRVYIATSSATVPTGQAVTATVTVKDYLDVQAPAGGQTVSISLSGGTSSGSVGAVTDNNNGTYTASITGITTGTAMTVNASLVQSYQVIQTGSLTVGSIHLAVTVQKTQMNPGGTSYVYAQVKDANGTNLTGGSYTINFSYNSGTSTGSFSAVSNLGNGLYRAVFSGTVGGTPVTITASSATTTFVVDSTQTIEVVPWSLKITASSSAVTVGQSVTLTGKVYDYQGTAVASGGQGFAMGLATTGVGSLSAVTDNNDGTYTATFTATGVGSSAVTGNITSSYTLTSTATLVTNALHLAVTVDQTQMNPGGTTYVYAQLKDAVGNNLSLGSYSINFSYTGGTSTGTFSTVSNQGGGLYRAAFTGANGGTAVTVSASSATTAFVVDSTQTIEVVPWSLKITAPSTTITIGQTVTLTGKVYDYTGALVTTGGKGFAMNLATSGPGNLASVIDNNDGTYTTTFTAVNAGSTSVNGSVSSSYTLTSTVTLVTTELHLAVTVQNAQMNPGGTSYVYVQTKNAAGTNISSGTYSLTFSAGGGTSTGTFSAVTSMGSGLYRATFTGGSGGTPVTISAASATAAFVVDSTQTIEVVPWSLKITSPSTAITLGQTVTLTGKVYDYAGALVTTGGKGFAMALATSGPGTLSAVADNNDGTYTATFTAVNAGTSAINGSVTASYTLTSTVTLVTTELHLAVTVQNAQMNPAGTSYVYVQTKNAAGGNISGGSYSLSFSYSGGTSTGSFSAVTSLGSGLYRATFTGASGGTPITISASSATAAFIVDSTQTIEVVPWSLKITASSTAVTVGQAVTLTGKVYDYTGTLVAAGGKGFAMALATTGVGALSAVTDNNDGSYTASFSATGVGSTAVTGNITSSYTLTSSVTLVSTAVHLSLSVAQSYLNPGEGVVVTAVVKDANGVNLLSSGYTIGFTYAGGSSTGSLGTTINLGTGAYTSTFTGNVAGTATTITANASVPFVVDQTVDLTVMPWRIYLTSTATNFAINETGTITASIKNWNNVTVGTGGKGVSLALSASGIGAISSTTDNSDGTYAANFAAQAVGTVQVTANMSQSFTVNTTLNLTVGKIYLSVTLGPSNLSSMSVASGSTVNARVTIKNSAGTLVTGTGYSIVFSAASGTSSISIDSAVSEVSTGIYEIAYRGVLAGTALTVSASSTSPYVLSSSAALTVVPSTVISAGLSTLTLSSSSVRSGSSVNLTATLKDAAGNTVPGLAGVTFSKTTGAGIGTGTLSSVTDAGNGVYTATFTGATQGATPTTIRVASGGVTVTQSADLTVTSGDATKLTVTGPTNVNANACSTGISLSFFDSVNNSTTLASTTTFPVANQGYGVFYSDSTCTAPLSSIEVAGGQSTSPTFYFKSFSPGAYNLNFSTASIIQTNASYTINVLPVLSWIGVAGSVAANESSDKFAQGYFDMTYNYVQGLTASVENGNIYLYVSDWNNHTVQKMNITNVNNITMVGAIGRISSGKAVPTDGYNSTACRATATSTGVPYWCLGGQYTSGNGDGQMNNPMRTTTMLIGGTNYAFVSDNTNHRILKYNADTGEFIGWNGLMSSSLPTTCTGSGTLAAGRTTPGWCKGGTATQSPSVANVGGLVSGKSTLNATDSGNQFNNPQYITNDGTNVYIWDSSNQRLVQMDPNTGAILKWMGRIASAAVGGVSGSTGISCYSNTQSDGTSTLTDGQFTPTWCTGGTSIGAAIAISGGQNTNLNPHFNSIRGIGFYSDGGYNWMAVSENNQQKIARYFCGPATATPNCSADPPVSGSQVLGSSSNRYWPGHYFGYTAYIATTATNVATVPADLTQFMFNTRTSTGGPTGGWAYYGGSQGSNGQTGSVSNSYGMALIGTTAYIASASNIRVDKLNLSTGTFQGWIGRISSTPSGGASGCAGASAGSITPGWCVGGSATQGQAMGAFVVPVDVATDGTYLYTADRDGTKIQINRADTGAVVGAIGLKLNTLTSNWSTAAFTAATIPTSTTLHAYSTYRDSVFYNADQMVVVGDYVYVNDQSNSRIKRYKWLDGSFQGWIGLTANFAPTGGEGDCSSSLVGGYTPNWCKGGGFAASSGFGFNQPRGLASDGTYLYVADQSNHRIVRIRLSDGAFKGWLGLISTSPSDGEGTCASGTLPTGTATPNWCLGGSSMSTGGSYPNVLRGFNSPQGLAGYTDSNGKYYLIVGDSGNARLQKINVNDPTDVSWVGAGNTASTCNGNVAQKMTTGWCTISGLAARNGDTPSLIDNGYLSTTVRSITIDTSTTPVYAYVTSSSGRVLRFNADTGAFGGWIGSFNNSTSNSDCLVTTGIATSKGTPSWCKGGNVTSGQAGDGQFSSSVNGVASDGTFLYVTDAGLHRVMRYYRDTGAFAGWMGRAHVVGAHTGAAGLVSNSYAITTGATPTTTSYGTGCSSVQVGAITPTWCSGGLSKGGYLTDVTTNRAAFDAPNGVVVKGAYIYVMDSANGRLLSIPKAD
jgi:Invasin, domain 3/Fibronectin type III domain